jgi:putative heme-binding domain-containing protein
MGNSLYAQEIPRSAPAGNPSVEEAVRTFSGRGELADGSAPTAPEESLKHFRLAEGLQIELVASEPKIAQPLFLNFDERGRLWVVQYRQYPFPAGLKVIHYDQHLRAVFDKIPLPPPHHIPGEDRVSIFEDLDGDGDYESYRDAITGLNIATSVVTDATAIWVLNPPYLLRYPDADGDGVPEGDPVVHLSGFGLEDTHSVANSLRWGPDGWLYAANGSTTTAKVRTRRGAETSFLGQCIWRYHPMRETFEIYAEGGGNTFSTEIDSVGRVFSGTNNGNTRGMYYPQGSYGVKNWGKHGPLTNPYAFGFFQHMRCEGDGDRFPQTFAIYEADQLPSRYRNNIIAANALHNRIWASELLQDTSSYRTIDLPPMVESTDRWFRPVDVKVGPDGAVYIADWYDSRLSHVDPKDDWHKTSGRIYRIRGTNGVSGVEAGSRTKPNQYDLTRLTSMELVNRLNDSNRFIRQTSVRVLGQRNDLAVVPQLREVVKEENHSSSLEAFWVLNWMNVVDEELSIELLRHPNEHLRRWSVRALGDRVVRESSISERLSRALIEQAARESQVQVRTQFASTAKRLPARLALQILGRLVAHDDAKDLHQPLLIWWGLEAHCQENRDLVLEWFRDAGRWESPLVTGTILERIMQRFGRVADWSACVELFKLAPTLEDQGRLASGLREALAGRKISDLPTDLTEQITKYQKATHQSDLPLRLRAGDQKAIAEAIAGIGSIKTNKLDRIELVEILGQIRATGSISVLLKLLGEATFPSLQRVSLQALAAFDDPKIGATICQQLHSSLPRADDLQHTALRVLASRPTWSKQLILEVESRRLKIEHVPLDVVQQMFLHEDSDLRARLEKHWGRIRGSPEDRMAEIQRVRELLKVNAGDLQQGRELYGKKCGTCHKLFGEGGNTGPELTGYERDNLTFLLPAIIDPSAAIREEFTNYQILTTDGRVLTGLIDHQDNQTVTLRGVDNQTTMVHREDIDRLQAIRESLMPEGIFKDLSDDQIRSLLRYVTTRSVDQLGR